MDYYDIAAKALLEACRDEIIRYFLNIDVAKSVLIETLPQETVSVKRSDYPVLITDKNGKEIISLIEIQTNWHKKVPLHLLDYRTRQKIKKDTEIISCVILLKASGVATDFYEDNEVKFKFRLIKIWNMNAKDIIEHGPLCLLPFVPLMKNGKELTDDADNLIYKSEISRSKKSDMLTSMAILAGIVDKELPAKLIERREDIMMESAAYEIIKQKGFIEGMELGIQKGKEEGIREAIELGLSLKFGGRALILMPEIMKINDINLLKTIKEVIKTTDNLEDIENILKKYS